MTGVVIGLVAGAGLLLVLVGRRTVLHPSLMSRVLPYVRDVHPDLAPDVRPSAWSALLGPPLRALVSTLGDLVGSAASVRRRLDRLGQRPDVDAFRGEQLVWGGLGFIVAAIGSAVLWSAGAAGPVLLVVCAIGFVLGVLARDHRLSSDVRRHERLMVEEFPAVADLLAIAVAAGETPTAGLERVVGRSHGALSHELGRVLADVRTGFAVPDAFAAMAARSGVPSIARFAEGLAVAVERGTPLVDVLHAQAADVREAARRDLIEAGGRREIAMMLPVVFLIMPTTIVFAFFPGYIGLRLTS
ncbi:MAG: type II secretion system F family protein [Aeromicrobium erythreum]